MPSPPSPRRSRSSSSWSGGRWGSHEGRISVRGSCRVGAAASGGGVVTTAQDAGRKINGQRERDPGAGPQFSLRIAPRWENVAEVRQQATAFLEAQKLSRDVVDAIAMVVCELTENATKYGEFTNEGDAIEVRLALEPGQVTVEVVNPVKRADNNNLSRLDETVQWIRGFQDPFEAYLNRLRELSTEGLEGTESRLGLVRIAYEGRAVLDFYINERSALAVSAIRRL